MRAERPPARLAGLRRPAAVLALVTAVALAAVPAGADGERSRRERPPFALLSAAWVLPTRPLVVTLEQSGVLAGRRLAVDLFIDDNQVQRVSTTGGRTPFRLALPELAPGRHVLVARTARESARAEFRVVPWSWLAGPLVALFAVAALVVALRRRRPRRV